jgi:sugar phosphate permease
MGGVLLFLITAMIGGGAFYYFKFLKNKPNIKGSTALEEYDFDEDDENAEEECEEEYQSDDDVEESEGDNQ